ncbi:MAG TPA: hypothetical protein VGR45_12840 [Stellaceae bacterium]|nr:hypothetical protein [Stellaceae bacterium]
MLHADLSFDNSDTILPSFLGVPEGGDGATEQNQRPGNIAPCRLETSFVAVLRSTEQGAYVFLEHGERGVGQPGSEARSLDDKDRRPPCRFEIGDVLHGHDRPLID